jgi:glycosyltransferase involved in cell wall biosynthesis
MTPSFNHGRFIATTIDSVLSQDYPRLEYIVVDGGSEDETLDILRSYGDRIVWRSAPDFGQADAVNAGFQMAKGEVLGWVNSDDTYCPGAIRAAVDYLVAHPDVAVVYGDAYYIDEQGGVIGTYPTADFDLERLATACVICQPAAFIRRDPLLAVGMLDPSLRYCMDYDLWIRMGRRFRIERIDRFLANSRRHPEAKSWSQRDEMFREISAVAERAFGRVSLRWHLWRAYYRLVDGGPPVARWLLWSSRQLLPTRIHHWLRARVLGFTTRPIPNARNSGDAP